MNSCIRLGRALEKYNAAWLEDMVPWYYTDLLKQINDAIAVPLLTGEDIYSRKASKAVPGPCRRPDPSRSGNIRRYFGDAQDRRHGGEYGVGMAMHFAGTPVSCLANVHCAAATQNFLALENHSVDVPWWNDLVTGVEKPIVDHGFITVPNKPGLGVSSTMRW